MKQTSLTFILAMVLMLIVSTPSANAQVVLLHLADNQIVKYCTSQLDSITFEEHDWVDLGLPSGTLWATCNVGANVPEGSGDYFAWGETKPKSNYTWSTYAHCNGTGNKLTKYCTSGSCGDNGFTDDLVELLPEDDAATANWGEKWQTPDSAQLAELFDSENTRKMWMHRNGRFGWLVTSIHNGQSIFMPACGSKYYGDFYEVNSEGCYWSRSLAADYWPLISVYLNFSSENFGTNRSYRNAGYSVRPVRKK